MRRYTPLHVLADDFADEPGYTPDERLGRLDHWRALLYTAARGEPDDPVFRALAHTIRQCDVRVDLLNDLLGAFRQDVLVNRYDTWDQVMDYCRRSANPVGRLVLRVAGVTDDQAMRASDALCTALQLANFWQDFGVDWRRGRLYVPREEFEKSGAAKPISTEVR